eukprot:CAMPEP_0181289214 /NCGR_PEP_ID=MMETSP1101-20121128/762_1 /TAXON_ID=46948 /ORGANISM="Rhodomonas abbreviata, Strain Caron Lab Isolate" /LENGTH=315 /DNA_ID=CAMNT_0023393419 /DNA_START=182 /DNA_END=1126 /DNA_ORIENTATION=-
MTDHSLYSALARRVILHIDMDAFYAQVEHRRTAIPMDEPLAVQQWEGLIAVNYAARARGVSRHMRVDEAKKLCPELHCVHVEVMSAGKGEGSTANESPAPERIRNEGKVAEQHNRHDGKVSLSRYRTASAEVFVALQRFGVVEKASIDEAYLDVTQQVESMYRNMSISNSAKTRGTLGAGEHFADDISDEDGDGECSNHGSASKDHGNVSKSEEVLYTEHTAEEELSTKSTGSNVYGDLDASSVDGIHLLLGAKICKAARAAVREETGFTCSGGISHNKMLSKLASARHKPNQQTIVPVRGVQSLMEQLPLKSIR